MAQRARPLGICWAGTNSMNRLSRVPVGSRRQYKMASTSKTPMEDAIRSKLTEAFAPAKLEIRNDSHLHAHHQAMEGVTSKETHFAVNIVSDAFASKMPAARHRLVYSLLNDEMKQEGGIHALQLRTKTLEEDQKQTQR